MEPKILPTFRAQQITASNGYLYVLDEHGTVFVFLDAQGYWEPLPMKYRLV